MNNVTVLNSSNTTKPIIDVAELAKLDTIAYGQTRDASAKALGVAVSILDKAVKEEISKQNVAKLTSPGEKIVSAQMKYAIELASTNDFAARGGVIFQWQNTHWEARNGKELEAEAIHFCFQVAPDRASEKLAQSAVATAALYLPRIPEIKANGFSQAPIIPTKSGYLVVDTNTITLRPADKADGITYVLDCGYDPFAKCDRFDAFLTESLPDSAMRDYLQEYFGYTLLSDTRHEIAAWLIGEGGTGKGTVGVVAQGLHRKVVALNLESINQYTMASLVDASLVYVDETPTGRISEQTIKTAISGDLISSDVKNRDPISFAPTAKWFINGNHLPPLSDHTTGFWRRFIIFPFDVKPSKKIPMLGESIVENELEGVLNWALTGLQRLIKRGGFAELPDRMQRMKDDAIKGANSVASWADECEVRISDDGTLTKKEDAYQWYSTWAKRNGLKPAGSAVFWQRMPAVLPGLKTTRKRFADDDGRQVPASNLYWPTPIIRNDDF